MLLLMQKMSNKHIKALAYASVVLALVFSIVLLALEIREQMKLKKIKKFGITNQHVVKYLDSSDETISGTRLRKLLPLLMHTFESRGRFISQGLIRVDCGSLHGNATLRGVVDCLCVIMRNRMRVSSRKCYVLSMDYYRRKQLKGFFSHHKAHEYHCVQLDYRHVSAVVLVGLEGKIRVKSESKVVVQAPALDVACLYLNYSSPRGKLLIDLTNDVFMIKFGNTTCLH